MVLFSVTVTLAAELSRACATAPPERVAQYEQALRSGEISLDVALALKRDLGHAQSVVALLRGSAVLVASPPARRTQSPETKKKFDGFRRELEEKQYRAMVKNVSGAVEDDRHRDRREIKSFRDQMGIALNVIITRLALLCAGWWVGHRALGAVWGPVIGVLCMIVGLVTEMGLFMIKADRLDKTLETRETDELKTFPGSTTSFSTTSKK